jgi:hypothetical protein
MKTIGEGLALGALIIAASLGNVVAQKTGLISPDGGTRGSMVIFSLIIAYYGNVIPKVIVRSERALAARRFAGWAFAMSGLASAALWIAAPRDIATTASIALIGSAIVLVFGYCLISRRRAAS